MSRTKGYRVRLVPQGGQAGEHAAAGGDYLMDGDQPQLFMTQAEAVEAAQEYLEDKPELTYLLEPVTP